jgi:ADP-ribose pyrophosphatase
VRSRTTPTDANDPHRTAAARSTWDGSYAQHVDDRDLYERTTGRRTVHRGRYLTFRVDTVVDAEGREHTREIVEHPGAVAIVPLDGDELLLVRQFRTPVAGAILELPAGTLDRAPDGSTEDPEVAARRELSEETGHRASSWRHLTSFWSAPGFTDERMHLYLATGLEPITGYDGPEADERLRMERVPWREAVAAASAGRIEDAKTLVGLLWLERLVERGELP